LALALTAACTAGTAGAGAGAANDRSNGGSGSYLNFFPCCFWGTTWSYNPYNVNALGIQNDFITLRLAVQSFPSMTDFTPQLATRWEAGDGRLVVHLREDAKWQDGNRVTSKDLYDTAIMDGYRGDSFWHDITDVKIIDDQTVSFVLRKNQPVALAENDILGMVIYPSQVYGRFVTDELAAAVKSYFRAAQQDPDKASKSPAFSKISDQFKKLAAYKVDTLIGDGPFQLQNITTREA
jgi:peptide/nickel transport system substrate-binding protein